MSTETNRAISEDGRQNYNLKQLNRRVEELLEIINSIGGGGGGGIDLTEFNRRLDEVGRVEELPFSNVDKVVIPCTKQKYNRIIVVDTRGNMVLADVQYNANNTTVSFARNFSGQIIIKY